MKDNIDRQPPFPQLYDCKAFGEICAMGGCFYQNVKERINPDDYPGEVGKLMEQEVKEMALQNGCKKAIDL